MTCTYPFVVWRWLTVRNAMRTPEPRPEPPGVNATQEAGVTVRDGYQPPTLRLEAYVPTRLEIIREEDNPCSEFFIVHDLGVDVAVPAFGTMTVPLPGLPEGRYDFSCGRGRLRGAVEIGPPRPRPPGQPGRGVEAHRRSHRATVRGSALE